MKIHRIEMWLPSAVGAAHPTLAFQWGNNDASLTGEPSTMRSAQAITPFQVAHLRMTPEKGSLASMWLSSSNDTTLVFSALLAIGAILEIEATYVFPDGSGNFSDPPNAVVSVGIVGATVGAPYVRGFPAAGAPTLSPVLYNAI
jgi:hypothetical protein